MLAPYIYAALRDSSPRLDFARPSLDKALAMLCLDLANFLDFDTHYKQAVSQRLSRDSLRKGFRVFGLQWAMTGTIWGDRDKTLPPFDSSDTFYMYLTTVFM